jgi:hypothetical protein
LKNGFSGFLVPSSWIILYINVRQICMYVLYACIVGCMYIMYCKNVFVFVFILRPYWRFVKSIPEKVVVTYLFQAQCQLKSSKSLKLLLITSHCRIAYKMKKYFKIQNVTWFCYWLIVFEIGMNVEFIVPKYAYWITTCKFF